MEQECVINVEHVRKQFKVLKVGIKDYFWPGGNRCECAVPLDEKRTTGKIYSADTQKF